jgi:plasmid stabilization system protein ParE
LEKEIIWTIQAKKDLQQIYDFNSLVIGEDKAFQLIDRILEKADALSKKIAGGTRYISQIAPQINYQKLILENHLIIFREEGNRVFVNRVFDARQDPKKLNL